jgi:hypothetical protein
LCKLQALTNSFYHCSGPIAILDPDGLKKETETWREKYVSLQSTKFNLDVKMNEAKTERKRLLQKIKALTKARYSFSQTLNPNSLCLRSTIFCTDPELSKFIKRDA